ncbi:MAG: hypothetical protein HQ541_09050, partial [Mariniphaga sp.]|nr:hypothetical protein [Mariniphaga sp.]
KFTNWDWIYGYSPAYSFKNKMNAGSKVLEVGLEVKKGIIQECQITGDYFPEKKSKLIEKELHYKKHDYPTIKEILDKIQIKVQNKIIDIFF